MTDFDHPSTLQALREAMYGGPALPHDALLQLLAAKGIGFPSMLVCIGSDPRMPEPRVDCPGLKILCLHPGLSFFHVSRSGLKKLDAAIAKTSLRRGKAVACADPRQWLRAAQEALVSLREQEIASAIGDPNAVMTHLEEQQLRRIAIQQVLSGHRQWRAAVELWAQCVLLRHRGKLHRIRRKVIELLTAMTQSIDIRDELEYPLQASIRRISELYILWEFPQAVCEIVAKLEPHVMEVQTRSLHHVAGGELVSAALDYLREHFREPLSTSEVADHLGVSSEHLARRFKVHVHRSLTDFVHALRVSHAQRLLIETSDGILEISLNSGFGSVEHFHRIFRRATGTTPAKYRRQSQW